MTSLSHLLTRLRARVNASQEGATMVEYGLMVALIAIVAIVAVELLGNGIFNIFNDANNALPNPGTTSP